MPTNLLKEYPELLEILHLTSEQRKKSLRGVYCRDIENNKDFNFRKKRIYPIKGENNSIDIDRHFTHLTCEEIQELDEKENLLPSKRIFEKDRSQRLHWIKNHIEKEKSLHSIQVFSVIERDKRKRKDVAKTYVYDSKEKYVIVLECQRCNSAYYLNRAYAEKEMKKKMKKKLNEVI